MKAFRNTQLKPMKLIKALRKTLSYVLIFSLLWQNCLWAVHGVHVLEEDLVGSRVRTYGARNVGVVDPGTVRDGAIHNMFEDLQLLQEGGIVFKTSPDAGVIYNRIHSEDPLYLSGVLQADQPTSMVFTNPGGIVLENPEFKNIEDLSLAAGHMALTNKGMAYGVDEGVLSLRHTLVAEDNNLKSLALSGRGIRLHKSFLSSSEALSLRSGHYIQGIDPTAEEWIDENGYFFESDDSVPSQLKGIWFDKSTTLRSKGLFLDSLEEGVSLYAKGLLQSTLEDITIFARGDVYLNRLVAKRNLKIETTGRVFFGGQSVVGGSIHINAKGGVEIGQSGDILSHGSIRFADKIGQVINRGKLIAQAGIHFEGQDVLNEGKLCAHQGVFFTDLKTLTNNGMLSAFGSGLQGKLKDLENEGKIDLSSAKFELEKGTNKKDGIIRTAGHFTHRGEHFYNHGKIFTCGIHQTTLGGTYEDKGTFYSPTLFLLQAMDVKYADSHKSFLKNGVIKATSRLTTGTRVSFTLNGNTHSCFLQLSSDGDLSFNGEVRQFSSLSAKYPIEDYFKLFDQSPIVSKDFSNRINSLSLDGSKKIRKDNTNLSGIILSAERSLNLRNANINPESGSLSLVADGHIETMGAMLKAGYFTGNHASIKGTRAILKDSTLQSLFGVSSITTTQCADLYNSHVLGGEHATITAKFVSMNQSTVKSPYGSALVHGIEKTRLIDSSVQSRSAAGVKGKDVSTTGTHVGSQDNTAFIEGSHSAFIKKSKLTGKQTMLHGGESLTLCMSTFESELNTFTGNHINATSNTTKGLSSFVANQSLKLHELQAEGAVQGIAPIVTLSDEIKTTHSLGVKGETVNQLGVTHANENSEIIATQHYVDTEYSRNRTGKIHSLIAPNNIGFNGSLTAEEEVVLDLKDMCLRALLNQTEAPVIKATLREGNITLEDDLVINNTLHLWGNCLENKAKLTANKDFLSHMQTKIINDGVINIRGNGTLSGETVENYGTMEASDLQVRGKHVLSERQVKRTTFAGGYQDILQKEAMMRARTGNLKVEAEKSLQARGAKFEAKGIVTLASQGTLYLGAQQTVSEMTHTTKNSYYHRYTLTNHKTQVNSGEKTEILSDQDMILEGIDVNAGGDIDVKSKANLSIKAVYDIFQEEQRKTSKGGFLKKKKTETRQESSQTVVRDTFKSRGKVRLEAQNENHVQTPDIERKGPTEILSFQDKVYLESAKSSHMVSHQKQSKSLVWQSQQQKGHYDEKVELAHIRAKGGITISGAKGIKADYTGDLDLLQNDPQMSWIKSLRKDPQATWHLIEEEHKKWNYKVQGLTGHAAVVISLAIAIATQGAGAHLIAGLTTNGTIGAIASAGFTSLVSQASLSLINNQGNIGRTFKELGSKENLKSLATSIASAGITHGLSEHFNLPTRPSTFMGHLQKSVVNSGTSAALSMLIHKQDVKDALLQAAKGIAADTMGGIMANKISAAYGKENLNWVTHKLAHGALGAFTGAILGDDPRAGALSGALGGIVSEIIADGMLEGAEEKAFDQALEKASNEGRPLEYKDVHEALVLETQKVANIGRLGAALTAFGLEQDVRVATATATNAVDNNFIPLVMIGLSVASALYSSYEVYSVYNEAGGGEEGAKAALKELAKQGLINAAGGVVAKGAGFALKAILAKNPMLAMIFSKAGQKLEKVVDAASNTKLGRAATKVEETGAKFVGKAKEKLIQNDILGAPRAGSGLKNDFAKPIIDGEGKWVHEFPGIPKAHGFPDMVDNYAADALKLELEGGAKLYQLSGSNNGIMGRFEWIIQEGKVTHRMFIENGMINGLPIKK